MADTGASYREARRASSSSEVTPLPFFIARTRRRQAILCSARRMEPRLISAANAQASGWSLARYSSARQLRLLQGRTSAARLRLSKPRGLYVTSHQTNRVTNFPGTAGVVVMAHRREVAIAVRWLRS